MFKNILLKQGDKTKEIISSISDKSIFIFCNSLDKTIPKIGDELIFDNKSFHIIKITSMITGKSEFDNYAIEVEEIL